MIISGSLAHYCMQTSLCISVTLLFCSICFLSCSTLSDEVSRLWRLTVLRPGVPPKQRKGMIEQLRTLNQTGMM